MNKIKIIILIGVAVFLIGAIFAFLNLLSLYISIVFFVFIAYAIVDLVKTGYRKIKRAKDFVRKNY